MTAGLVRLNISVGVLCLQLKDCEVQKRGKGSLKGWVARRKGANVRKESFVFYALSPQNILLTVAMLVFTSLLNTRCSVNAL